MSGDRRAIYIAEPPAAYRQRPPLVVDCSVLAALLFAEVNRDTAVQRMAGRQLHAPFLLDFEITSVALKKWAQGWPEDSIEAALDDFGQQDIELHRTDVRGQLELALQYELSAYDAAYLWLAAELRAPLVTFDRRLGEAAQRHLGAL